MEFDSIQQIKEHFSIASNDVDIIQHELNQMRILIHPDKNMGEFRSEEDKTKFHEIGISLEYIAKVRQNGQVAIVERMTDLIKTFSEMLPANKEHSLQAKFETKIDHAIKNYRSPLFIPKISLTAISALLTFLVALPKYMKENQGIFPVDERTLNHFWFPTVIITGICWLFTYQIQEREKQRLSMLKVDAVQNKLFTRFLDERREIAGENALRFSKDDLTNFICMRKRKPESIELLFHSPITLDVAQGIAEIIISRYEGKGLIKKDSTQTSLSDNYRLISF